MAFKRRKSVLVIFEPPCIHTIHHKLSINSIQYRIEEPSHFDPVHRKSGAYLERNGEYISIASTSLRVGALLQLQREVALMKFTSAKEIFQLPPPPCVESTPIPSTPMSLIFLSIIFN
ncbi:hypothetical protein AVEN_104555-1 [Araneus ventricosus]|uniref:Uncharacterized protein n=1 Tax=Araneus ventricosus TaxID=182803 RepID=A0A4Y2VYL0_ARAVE|nr:hypothetical protein AVEN_104555-1 [Araneus ventricosus]